MDTSIYADQHCFTTVDGFRVCNFVIRNGKKIESKSGGWLKFPVRGWVPKQNSPDLSSESVSE